MEILLFFVNIQTKTLWVIINILISYWLWYYFKNHYFLKLKYFMIRKVHCIGFEYLTDVIVRGYTSMFEIMIGLNIQ